MNGKQLLELVKQWIGPKQDEGYVIVVRLEDDPSYRRLVIGSYDKCVVLTTKMIGQLIEAGLLKYGIKIEVYPGNTYYGIQKSANGREFRLPV